MDGDSIDFHTLEYLFNVQQALSSSATTKRSSTDASNDTSGKKRIAAYYRWHLNNRLDQCEQDVGTQKKPSIVKGKRGELVDLCASCNSVLTQYKSIPKKLKHKKRKKKGHNYDITRVNARCGYCKANFQFNGLKKSVKIPAPVQNSNFINSRTSVPGNSNSTNRKHSLSALKTPTSSKSHKEALQKLLSESKKQRNLDSKTRLSDFLSSCFK